MNESPAINSFFSPLFFFLHFSLRIFLAHGSPKIEKSPGERTTKLTAMNYSRQPCHSAVDAIFYYQKLGTFMVGRLR